jgi:hypothetical protein
VLETRKERIAKDLAVCSQSLARPSTPDCPVVHRTVSGAPGWFPVNRPLSENVWRRTVIIHRTVRWCTGLSGEPTVASATVDRAIHGRRVARTNGRQGAPDCPMCTGQCPVRQRARSCNGHLRQNRKEIAHRTATVTVWWCTGLSGAPPDRGQVWPSLIGLQRLLAALGL